MPCDAAAHVELIHSLSVPGGPLTAIARTATVNNPVWFSQAFGGDAAPTADRDLLQRRLMGEQLAAFSAEWRRQAVVMAGPPGAGKGTVCRADFDPSGFVVIDADEFKAALLREAISDGSYESWIKPTVVKDLEARGERFAPMELASLVHEESSLLAASMRASAVSDGWNIMVDSVTSDARAPLGLGRQLMSAGYRVTVVDVEVPFEVSAAAIRERYRDGYERALAGEETLGGRWVPSEYARGVFNGSGQPSKPELAARVLAERCPMVMEYRLYPGSEPNGPRFLDTCLIRRYPGGPLIMAD
ncbi:MAG: zeta toxin family protein [Bifidobacteriaceae bacterium]|jgi:chloramphenicol 3-O-phosphotransferase|nr:zeta toxin family protein [Bifidobacteriaceae bacterium]